MEKINWKEGRGLRFQLERSLLILQFRRYHTYKTFQSILKHAEKQKISFKHSYIQVNLKIIFKNISLDSTFYNSALITPELIEKAFQKLDVFIDDYQAALEKSK